MNTTGRTSELVRTTPATAPEETSAGPRRPWLALYAALLAVGAWAGAAGLVLGFLALPRTLEDRLPFGSPVLGGTALALLVALPASVLTVMAWHGHRRVLHVAVLDGVLLIGWIVVQVAFIRGFGVLHAVYLVVGLGLVVWGRAAIPDLVSSVRRSRPVRAPMPDVDALRIWRPAVAYSLLAFAALGYAVVALVLALAHARATPEPYLRIDATAYFTWGTIFYAPAILAAWLLASDVVWLLATAIGRRRPDFGAVLTAMAAAVGVGTLATLLPDLVTSPLRALGVIDEAAWETSISQHTGWFVFTWCSLALYVLLFLFVFPLAVRHSTSLRGAAAAVTGVLAFGVLQGVEYLFVR
jgi:hypothetical protein